MLRIVLALLLVSALAACDMATDAFAPMEEAEIAALALVAGDTGEEVGGSTTIAGYAFTTNLDNKNSGLPYVEFVEARVGEVDLRFVSAHSSQSCFENRSDLEAPDYAIANYNTGILDGLWSFLCLNSSSAGTGMDETRTYYADEYVDIRRVFGAERDWDFDWTRFPVLTIENKDECKTGQWEALGFRNQGQCIAYFNTN